MRILKAQKISKPKRVIVHMPELFVEWLKKAVNISMFAVDNYNTLCTGSNCACQLENSRLTDEAISLFDGITNSDLESEGACAWCVLCVRVCGCGTFRALIRVISLKRFSFGNLLDLSFGYSDD